MATGRGIPHIVPPAELERLGAIHSPEGILSVYLKIDPRLAYDRHQAEAKFKGGARRFERTADERARVVLERERGRVLDYLREWEPAGRSLVIFASQPAGLYEVFNPEVMLPTYIAVDERPHIKLLTQIQDEYPRTAVVMLDGGDGRIYLGTQGETLQVSQLDEELPGRHDQGGWSQARFQRHVEFHHDMHLRAVAERLQDVYFRHWPFESLVVVGVNEAVDEFRELLPEPMAQKYAGSVPGDFKHESDEAILERARELLAERERAAEVDLVRAIVGQAAAGGRGVVGIEQMIREIINKRVQTLAIADGLSKEGSACPNCSYFSTERFERCPACDMEAEQVDVIEFADERAYLDGAHVEVLFGEGRKEMLAHGGLGALLRY